MPKLTCIQPDGQKRVVEAASGTSVMQAIMSNDVPGLLAECGGACACATCHVYVDEQWLDRVPAKGDVEDSMLEAAFDGQANSRLACQILLTADLDGLVVHIPDKQV